MPKSCHILYQGFKSTCKLGFIEKVFTILFCLCVCVCFFLFRYRTLGHTASQSRISTFYLLLDLMQFFDLYHAGQLDTALDVSF